MTISLTKMQANFNRAAAGYDRHASFQQAQMQRVLSAARAMVPAQSAVLDIGCGTGMLAAAARGEGWRITGLDIAAEMCRMAATRCAATVNANATALPFADASFDAVVSSLCLQWVAEPALAFGEIHRVVKPGGVAIIASLGAETLKELRAAAGALPLGLLAMRTRMEYQELATQSGFEAMYIEDISERHHYPSARALLQSMRQIGAGNARRAAAPKKLLEILKNYDATYADAQGVFATWQPILMQLRKPA